MLKPSELHDHFTAAKKYGTLKFVYKAGKLVFTAVEQTFIADADEKNSKLMREETHGAHDFESRIVP